MDARRNGEGWAQFAGALAQIVGQNLKKTGAIAGDLQLGKASARSSESPVDAVLPLRFEGALIGECFVAVGASVPGEENGLQQLAQALGGAVEPFAAALSAQYGSVRVHLQEEAALPNDAEPIASLEGAAADGTPIAIELWADGELARGLSRLARVRAAAEASGVTGGNLGLVMDVELNVALRFGQRQLSLREVMDLSSGSVVELDREVDEPVELILDGRVIARGEAVIVDGNYGVRVTEVLHPVVM